MEYTYDTLSLKQIHECLGKYVKVHLLTGFKTTTTASLEGYLYTIDPITKTLVLLKEKKVTEDSQVPDMEKEGNTREKDQEENGKFINKYQILVIMRSIIQTLCVVNEIKPLSNEKIKTIVPNQDIVYLEKTDSIENLKNSLIEYLQKNKIDYNTQPEELSIKIYNDNVEILPPYTQSSIKSENYGSKNLAIYHIKKWWNEKK